MNVSDLGAAVHSPDDGWLDPHSVLMGFRNKARAMGAEFLAEEVVGLVRQGNSVTTALLGTGTRLEASHYVNAAGAWAKDVLCGPHSHTGSPSSSGPGARVRCRGSTTRTISTAT
jgi:glycine/D-amino acid oxidase-like deaminating enzyme